MFRILGVPPTSEYIELAEQSPSFSTPAETGRAKLCLTPKQIKVFWADGTVSTFSEGSPSFLSQFRNRIINGDFAVWQRGTSKTGVTAGGYHTADRWSVRMNTGAMNLAKSAMNGWNSFKVTVNTVPSLTVSGNYFSPFEYRFEGSHLYDLAYQAKSVTLSFLFRSNVTGVFSIALRNATGGTVTESYVTEFTYPTANSVQEVTVTIPLNYAFTSLANDSNLGFMLNIASLAFTKISNLNTWQSGNYATSANSVNWASAVGNYVEIARVQLEEGNTKTDFEVLPFDVQLLRCLRYFYSHSSAVFAQCYYPSSTPPTAFLIVDFPVPMRATPTLSYTVGSGFSVTGNYTTARRLQLYGTIQASAGISVSNLTADAEL